VTQVLWDYPDSLLRPGYEVSKDFIDCWWNPLPSWGPGTRVIVYCEALPGQGYNCVAPVMFTDDRLFRVKKWVAELSGRERNPDLLKMHYWLRDSLELGPSRPLLLLGQVTWVTPKSRWLFNQSRFYPRCASQFHICSRGITKRGKSMRSAPPRLLNVAVGTNVIAYCEAMGVYRAPPASCALATPDTSDESVKRAERWAAQARQHQRALIVEHIRKYLANP
jgi:hypothetical protein